MFYSFKMLHRLSHNKSNCFQDLVDHRRVRSRRRTPGHGADAGHLALAPLPFDGQGCRPSQGKGQIHRTASGGKKLIILLLFIYCIQYMVFIGFLSSSNAKHYELLLTTHSIVFDCVIDCLVSISMPQFEFRSTQIKFKLNPYQFQWPVNLIHFILYLYHSYWPFNRIQVQFWLNLQVSKDIYFMKQTISNACGTVAMIHAVGNSLVMIKTF